MEDLIRRKDAIAAVRKYFMGEINSQPYRVGADGEDEYTDRQIVNGLLHHNKMVARAIRCIPSAEQDSRMDAVAEV